MDGADPAGDQLDERGPSGWTVWRQDDNGNRYQVSRHDTRTAAESVAAAMDARGHKQTYWVSPSS